MNYSTLKCKAESNSPECIHIDTKRYNITKHLYALRAALDGRALFRVLLTGGSKQEFRLDCCLQISRKQLPKFILTLKPWAGLRISKSFLKLHVIGIIYPLYTPNPSFLEPLPREEEDWLKWTHLYCNLFSAVSLLWSSSEVKVD